MHLNIKMLLSPSKLLSEAIKTYTTKSWILDFFQNLITAPTRSISYGHYIYLRHILNFWTGYIEIYPVSQGYLRKIPVERRGKFPEPPQGQGKFPCPRNRYLSQITLTNRIYLFNSAEYLTSSKTVAYKNINANKFEI